jgi:YHS domain-containing protein
MIVGWILKLLLIWLVVRGLIRLGRGIADGLRGGVTTPPAVALVRDPVCGTFVAPAASLSFGTGTQVRYFCSENCRRIYQMKFPR